MNLGEIWVKEGNGRKLLPYVRHKVQNQFGRKNIMKTSKFSPFCTYKDFDPQDEETSNLIVRKHKEKPLPISDPLIGHNCGPNGETSERITKRDSKRQTPSQWTNALFGRKWRQYKTIQFIKVLGTGGYGKVWLITYIAQKPGMYNQNEAIYTEVSEACKVLQLQRNDKTPDYYSRPTNTVRYFKPSLSETRKHCPNARLNYQFRTQKLTSLLRRFWCLWSYATEIWWTSSTSTYWEDICLKRCANIGSDKSREEWSICTINVLFIWI